MIKKAVLFLFLLIIISSFVSAVEIEMDREFQQGSLFSAKISGTFIAPPLKENVLFYRDEHIRVAINPDMIKINDDYYISATLPQAQNNFSMGIKDVKYYNGTKISEEDIEENFSTTEELAVFSATPGVIITDKDFTITMQNLQPGKRTIISQISDLGDSFELQSGEIKKITFDIGKLEPLTMNYLDLSSGDTTYLIPVYIFKNSSAVEKERAFEFDPLSINLTLPTNSSGKRVVFLNNIGDKVLNNISLIISNSLKGILNLSVENISELEVGSKVRMEVEFLPQSEEANLQGHVAAKEENMYTYLTISVNFLENFIPSEKDTYDPYANITLKEEPKKDTGSWGKLIGWLLVAIVVIAALWFFLKKYRGAKAGSSNLLKIGSKK